MAGGDLNSAISLQGTGGKIHLFAAGHTNINHAAALIHQSARNGLLESR
ncbi:hypothetical protein SRABI106_01351 [Rahnella aquatilis]|nr:hypothetical protein SRABI106_01351 [Rahnella aquatilis]